MPHRPILVTGVPRSGTTWLARQLAHAPGTALTGREPMNPHSGQYALGSTISAWAQLTETTAQQARILRRAYRGQTPRVYGRYGARQWAAPLPRTTVVVKDPFAMLSIGSVHQVTGALPVLLYRHPGAVLASYRRMGWQPDLAEVTAALAHPSPPDPADQIGALAWFWAALNQKALADLAQIPGALVISHEELATGGEAAMRRVYAALGLTWKPPPASTKPAPGSAKVNAAGKTLHRLDRPAEHVASAWRASLTEAELAHLTTDAGPTLAALREQRLDLSEFSSS